MQNFAHSSQRRSTTIGFKIAAINGYSRLHNDFEPRCPIAIAYGSETSCDECGAGDKQKKSAGKHAADELRWRLAATIGRAKAKRECARVKSGACDRRLRSVRRAAAAAAAWRFCTSEGAAEEEKNRSHLSRLTQIALRRATRLSFRARRLLTIHFERFSPPTPPSACGTKRARAGADVPPFAHGHALASFLQCAASSESRRPNSIFVVCRQHKASTCNRRNEPQRQSFDSERAQTYAKQPVTFFFFDSQLAPSCATAGASSSLSYKQVPDGEQSERSPFAELNAADFCSIKPQLVRHASAIVFLLCNL